MGHSISWLTVSGKDVQALRYELGFETTGRSGEFADFKLAGHVLPGGAYLLLLQHYDHPFISDRRMAELSVGSTALGCSIEEHVQGNYIVDYAGGRDYFGRDVTG
jgi:hypothetical protein